MESTTAGTEIVRDPSRVVALYSRLAPIYEVWGRLVDGRARRRVVELAGVRDGDRVLEVACGTGAQLLELARPNPGGRNVGVELAPGMVERANRRVAASGRRGVEVRQADARALPFEDASFDVLTNLYMLDILAEDDMRAVLAEFARVLRPGGRLVVVNVTPGERRRHRLPDLLYGSRLPLTGNCRGIHAAPLVAEAGFTDVRREYSVQLQLPSEVIAARRAVLP